MFQCLQIEYYTQWTQNKDNISGKNSHSVHDVRLCLGAKVIPFPLKTPYGQTVKIKVLLLEIP